MRVSLRNLRKAARKPSASSFSFLRANNKIPYFSEEKKDLSIRENESLVYSGRRHSGNAFLILNRRGMKPLCVNWENTSFFASAKFKVTVKSVVRKNRSLKASQLFSVIFAYIVNYVWLRSFANASIDAQNETFRENGFEKWTIYSALLYILWTPPQWPMY